MDDTKLTIQTTSAFERIDEALIGKTEDDLDEIIQNLDNLLHKAKKIKNFCNSNAYDGDFIEPEAIYPYCDLPN